MADLDTPTRFAFTPHPAPVPEAERAARLADPGFGKTFTDHMAMVRYSEARGWHDASIVARGPISLDPAAAVLHYAQEIFEGLKAYRLADGSMALFRPDANARRFNASADRMAMPQLPEHLFVESVKALVRADCRLVPRSRRRLDLSAPLHVRLRGVSRRQTQRRISLSGHCHRSGQLFQERRSCRPPACLRSR